MIVVPITANNVIDSFNEIRDASKVADVIELRCDYLFTANRIILRKLLRYVKSVKKDVIVTSRDKKHGGAGIIDNKNKVELMMEAIKQKAQYFDIEVDKMKLLKKVDMKKIKKELEDSYGVESKKFENKIMQTKVIVSYHNFKKTPDIMSMYNKIRREAKKYKLKSYVVKIVTFANSVEDNLKIFRVLEKAKKDKQEIIAFCMGEQGEMSRVLCKKYGSMLTFGTLKGTKMTAPGQLDAYMLRDVYRVNRLDEKTKVFGLVGNPVSESKGYLVHNMCFVNKKINAVYVNFLVKDIKKFVKNFRDIVDGFSVTMPFKQTVVKHLDKVDNAAKRVDAVNTVVIEKNKLIGYNTDYSAALEALKKVTKLQDRNVLLLGAGGVAKAILTGLEKEGSVVVITDVDENKAKKLAKEFNVEYCNIRELHDIEFDVLINATPVGMHPNVDMMPVDNMFVEKIDKKTVVFDVIYNPEETRLLKEAIKRKARIVSGIEMFVLQAREQFKLFTKKMSDLRFIRRVVTKGR